MTLSDTHLVLLSAASQRDDRLLPRPDKLAGVALHNLRTRLIGTGVAEPLVVRHDEPHWQVDEAGDPVGLRITAAGLNAIGLDVEGLEAESLGTEPADAASSVAGLDTSGEDDATGPASHGGPGSGLIGKGPRPGSKQALLIDMLRQEGGTSIDAIVRATGWLPHTARAALTHLRHKGHVLAKSKADDNRTVYRLTSPEPAIERSCDSEAA